MKQIAVAVLLGLAVAPVAALHAGEITAISYEVDGALLGEVVDLPLFSAANPGPGGFGSRATLEFESQGGVPLPSGSVRIRSLTLSLDLRLTGLFTGWAATRLLPGPITGGHLVGGAATGRTSDAGMHYGLFDCIASPAACYAVCCPYATIFSGVYPLTWPTVVPFTVASGPAAPWEFNPEFTQVSAVRSACTSFIVPPWLERRCYGRSGPLQVHGTEISRTITTPEPTLLPMVLLFAAGAIVLALRRS